MGVFGFFSSLMIWEAGASTREAQQTRGGGAPDKGVQLKREQWGDMEIVFTSCP